MKPEDETRQRREESTWAAVAQQRLDDGVSAAARGRGLGSGARKGPGRLRLSSFSGWRLRRLPEDETRQRREESTWAAVAQQRLDDGVLAAARGRGF